MNDSLQLRKVDAAASKPRWRGYLVRFLLSVTLSLFSIAVLNYLVNPEGLFDTHLLPQLVWWYGSPQKAAMLKALQPPPQALIMGSSRVMNMAPAEIERLTRLRAFNAGIYTAKAEDFYVLLRYTVEKAQVQPKLLIIGCDVENFHNHETVQPYLRQPSLLSSYLWRNESRYWRWRQFTELFTFEETELSLTSLRKMGRGKKAVFYHMDQDGHVHYDQWERDRASGQLDLQRASEATVKRFGPRYDTYTGLSEERLAYFDATLQYAHDHGIEVIVFLTPMHPAVQQGLGPHGYYARKQQVTAALQHICATWNDPFYDFSSSASFGGDDNHFYDGLHYDDTFAPLVLSRMLPLRAHALQ